MTWNNFVKELEEFYNHPYVINLEDIAELRKKSRTLNLFKNKEIKDRHLLGILIKGLSFFASKIILKFLSPLIYICFILQD